MNISSTEEYGLRCALRLATLAPEETLSATDIAEQEGLSAEYVSKFMLHFRKAGLVQTVRGAHGGFALARSPQEISMQDVFDALSGKKKKAGEFCDSFSGKNDSCVRLQGCSIRPVWGMIASLVEEFTRDLKLSDLLQPDIILKKRKYYETITRNSKFAR